MISNPHLTLPKRLVINSLFDIISRVNFIFNLDEKKEPDFFLNVSKVKSVDIIGILILYKFIEYAVVKSCFSNPMTNYNHKSHKIDQFVKHYGFEEYFNAYIKKKDLNKALNKLDIETKEGFIIAPQVLTRGNIQSKKNFDIKFKKELLSFYGLELNNFIQAILQCAVEISSNFYSHAKSDTKSIILAKGSKGSVEIACADTGDGLLETLKDIDKYSNTPSKKLIVEAFKKNVTSKPNSNHMGYGLWFLKEIIKRYNGYLDIYSSKTNYSCKFGRERVIDSPNWKGTIVYINIPVKNGIDIADIIKENRQDIGFKPLINFKN